MAANGVLSSEKRDGGVWEVKIPSERISHGDLYKLHLTWPGGAGERIPAWANGWFKTKQPPFQRTGVEPEQRYQFNTHTSRLTFLLLIYETHVECTEEEKVGSYNEFRRRCCHG